MNQTNTTTNTLSPTETKQRFVVLDSLRGFALLLIIIANLPEFGLWTFLSSEAQAAMPSASIDRISRFFHYFLIDGKGYGIFSILFGCGFSIIISHAMERGSSGIALFYRRMTLLLCFALIHIFLLWSGDILCLYAVIGMLLPLFHRLSNKWLLVWAAVFLLVPVFIDFAQQLTATYFAQPIENAWWNAAYARGINEENFAQWLVDAKTYGEVSAFLMQGAVERMWEFVDGNRLPKVLGLFLIGYYFGRNKLYARISELYPQLKNTSILTALIGIPTSLLYAYDCMTGHVWGRGVASAIYLVSVTSLTLLYISLFCMLWNKNQRGLFYKTLAYPGRMALSNYIGQSVIGIIIYYGIGFGLGLTMGHAEIVLTAVCVFLSQTLVSALWLHYFRYGLLEWLWRMLTYGKHLKLTK